MVDGVHDVDVAARSNGNSIDKNAVAHAGTDSVACLPLESSWLKRKSRSFERCFDIQSEPKKRRNKSSNKKETESEFETVWICVECKEAECMMEPEATDLLICDGLCRRLFHYPCAGLEKLPQEDEEFICTDCKNRKHICSICSNYGNDNEDVFNCSKNTCGLFFHESCLAIQNVDVEVVPEDDAKTDVEKSVGNFDFAGTVVMRRRFVCPAHSCWTCTQTDLREQEKTTNAGVPVAAKPRSKGKSRKKIVKQPGVFESKCERFMTVSWIYLSFTLC